jgi:DNA-binding NarL/FixJ family response regulator
MSPCAAAGPDEQRPAFSRVLVVEDDIPTWQRLRRVLLSCGATADQTAHAPTLSEGKRLSALDDLSLVLVDVGLPDGNGIDLIAELHHSHPLLPCVVVSSWSAQETIVAALRAGAAGYLLKEREDIEIEYSLRSIDRGGAPIDPFVAKRILQLLAVASDTAGSVPGPSLSSRERDILKRVDQGLSNGEIADQLSLSRLTVESHTRNIYRKLAVKSRTAAVHHARQHGWL